jgi:GntR family transcriptional repressor for pyruvate dehydrogenase complex
MMLRTPADYATGVELHERTLELLMRGEPDEIEAEFLRHLSHFEEIVEDVLGRKSVRTVPSFISAGARHASNG